MPVAEWAMLNRVNGAQTKMDERSAIQTAIRHQRREAQKL